MFLWKKCEEVEMKVVLGENCSDMLLVFKFEKFYFKVEKMM